MKKLLAILLTLLMIFTLVGCNSKEDTPIVNEPEQQEEVVEPIEDEPIVGGFVDAEDKTITDELKDIFNKALDGLTGAKYEPVELVATQVVAGTNYKFLANGTKTTNPITKGTYYITIYKDLQGNVELLDIETIEEKQEETSQTKKDILKTYNYWVVFFDHDGNELQREAIKWGTTPTYWSDIPYYEDGTHWYKFTGWKDRWGRDVKEFKPITGNARFYAQYEIGGEVSHYHSEPTPEPEPVPTPTPIPTPEPIPDHTQVECLTSSGGTNGSYIDSNLTFSNNVQLTFEAKMTKSNWSRPFGYYFGTYNGVLFQTTTSGFSIYIGNGNTSKPYSGNINRKIVYDVTINSGRIIVKLDDWTLSNDACANPSAQKITIFSLVGILGDVNDQPLSIYSMKIKKDDVLERDFIPVKTNKELDKSKNATDPTSNIPANTLCFYDQQNDLYYLNSGTAPFTDIPIPD